MERKRDGLVSIGEAGGGLAGPVKPLRKTPTPGAATASPVADQVNQLVSASEVQTPT